LRVGLTQTQTANQQQHYFSIPDTGVC
jgi:hypothetical protein